MKVAVVGSRTFSNYDLLCNTLNEHREKISLIISGGAKGADTLAQKYARDNGIPILIYYPDWEQYGKKAGLIRNTLIAEQSDIMIGFREQMSMGTSHAIDYMRDSLNKPAVIVDT